MKFRKLSALLLTVAVTGSALTTAAAYGTGEPEKRFPASQYRHDVMEHFSYGFKKLTMIMKGQAGSKDDIAAIAAIMAEASTMTKRAFEKDTRGMQGHTEAKAKIWDNWEDFAGRFDKLEKDAAAFAAVAKTGDMAKIKPAMAAVGKSCKSCHDDYKDD